MATKRKTRKLKVVGHPWENSRNYIAIDAATGVYLKGQVAVEILTDEDTGKRTAQIVIHCDDITELDAQGNEVSNGSA